METLLLVSTVVLLVVVLVLIRKLHKIEVARRKHTRLPH